MWIFSRPSLCIVLLKEGGKVQFYLSKVDRYDFKFPSSLDLANYKPTPMVVIELLIYFSHVKY